MIPFLYITDDNDPRSHGEQIEEVSRAGVQWVQLRVKNTPYTEWLRIAEEAREITARYRVKLTVNDNVRIAKEVSADGVHLGRHDLNPIAARHILGPECTIGGTANTLEEVEKLIAAQVDYIGLGPYQMTETKENIRETLGISGVQGIIEASSESKMPIVVIGGIEAEDVAPLFRVGVSGVAVGGSVRRAPNLQVGIEKFLTALKVIDGRGIKEQSYS